MTSYTDTRDPDPCSCWTLRPVLHDGHCCFRGDHYERAERGEQPFCHDGPEGDE